jgi:Leucine-rich repeat (LRR) protein
MLLLTFFPQNKMMFALFFIACSQNICSFSSPLKEAIESRVGLKCEQIEVDKMESLNLSNWNEPISNTSDLQKLTNIKTLRLSDSKIENIEFVTHMPKIQTLHLDFTSISNIEPLQNSSELSQLWLDETKVSSIKPLQNLTSLTELSLRNTEILDITALESLSGLTILDLSGTQIQDISPLKNHQSLRVLSLRNTQIRSIEALQKHSQMLLLDIRKNRIKDISIVEQMSGLRALDVGLNQLQRLPTLPSSIIEFNFESNPIHQDECLKLLSPWKEQCLNISSTEDNDFLQKCLLEDNVPFQTQVTIHTLQDLFQSTDCAVLYQRLKDRPLNTNEPILDVDFITEQDNEPLSIDWKWIAPCYQLGMEDRCIPPNQEKGKKRKTGFVQMCESKNDSTIQKTIDVMYSISQSNNCSDAFDVLSKMTSLDMTKTGISNLEPLQFFPQLRSLRLEYNQISNLSPLQYLLNLQILFLDDNQISDISSLSPLTQMLWFSIGDNQIENVSYIENMKYLRRLWLGGNKIKNIDVLQHNRQLRKLHLASNQIQDISVLSNLHHLENIYLADNQISNIESLAQIKGLKTLMYGLDENESPLAIQQWFLKDNPIANCPSNSILPLEIFCLMYNK